MCLISILTIKDVMIQYINFMILINTWSFRFLGYCVTVMIAHTKNVTADMFYINLVSAALLWQPFTWATTHTQIFSNIHLHGCFEGWIQYTICGLEFMFSNGQLLPWISMLLVDDLTFYQILYCFSLHQSMRIRCGLYSGLSIHLLHWTLRLT